MTPEQQLVQQIIQVIHSNQLEGNVLLTDYSEQFAEMRGLYRIAAEGGTATEPLDWLDNSLPGCWRIQDGEATFDWWGPDELANSDLLE